MAISISFIDYLSKHDIDYELISHRHTTSSIDSSFTAHLPSEQVAKAIILQSNDGDYLMASLSVGHRLSISQVNELTGKQYNLVNEVRLSELFPDCEQGAIPGIGEIFKINMLVDDALLNAEQIYIEAGDHCHLVKINQRQYTNILLDIPHGNICGATIGRPKMAEHLSSEWRLS
ncbi:MAG: YbaK/EbsC family protein [Alteromonadaceae bacterium]|nr:YbaK/EbsC family protein [Alteromonadaceae bacterium]